MKNCYFPEDVVVIEILSRLPVKTLTRFKCVCKSWYDFIRSPLFIQKHLLLFGKSTTTNGGKYKDNGLFIVSSNCNYYDTPNKNVEAYFIQVSSSVDDNNVCSSDLDIKPFSPRPSPLPLLVGSCNGIVCLTDYAYLDFYEGSEAILWNPATRELKTLPTSDHITGLYTEWGYRRGSLGFGFDAKSNDYKVVRIASCRGKELTDSISPLGAVYSLATDSWKAIDCQATFMCFEDMCTMNVNGICYWATRDVNWGLMILSFDMADEVFEKIPPPNQDCHGKEGDSNYNSFCNLVELRGLLALVINVRNKYYPDFFDIWLIDKNGENCTSSWVRHLKLELQVFVKEPLGFWLDGEEFLFIGGESRVLSYNIKSQVIRDFHINHGIPTSSIFEKRCVLYTESLVSLNTGTT